MKLPQPLVVGRLIQRLNRFTIVVRLDDERRVFAHLPNSGRLQEVLQEGNPFWLTPRIAPHRRTGYDAVLSCEGSVLVSIDARMPPKLLMEGIAKGTVKAWRGVQRIQPEVPLDHHRFDLLLDTVSGPCWVETKSVTLVRNGIALFPDAPTLRGQEHLRVLTKLSHQGVKAAIVFVVQRPDARCFAPNEKADLAFAQALRDAAKAGVRIFAYRCHVDLGRVEIVAPIPVLLSL